MELYCLFLQFPNRKHLENRKIFHNSFGSKIQIDLSSPKPDLNDMRLIIFIPLCPTYYKYLHNFTPKKYF